MVKINAAIISVIVICFAAAFLILPKSDFSENENRSLADFPSPVSEDILNGNYMSEISAYLNDHFPLREQLVNMKTEFEIEVLKSKYINNIYIADDSYYIEGYEKPENTDRIINNLNKFQDSINVKADFMLVPTQVCIYENKLPRAAKPLSQLKTIDRYYSNVNMNCVDVYDILNENKDKEQLYFKLDHHWTMDGAYYAYVKYCDEKGFTPVSRNEYLVETVENFKGTIFSKLNYNDIIKGEPIKVYNKKFNIDVKYDDKKSNSLYNMDYADKKDKYSIFLNNINSVVEITNNDLETDRSLAIAKDSYANAIVPFLVNHYKKIYVFDTRSYKNSVSEFVNGNNIDDVLVLYNVNTIDKDTGINAIY